MVTRRTFEAEVLAAKNVEFVELWLTSQCEGACCRTPGAPARRTIDPYDMELYGVENEVILCEGCRRARAMEV